MSGLNQYVLTQAEDQFLKTALEDFRKNHMLAEHQEDRLESLYKEKSQSIPNKKSDRFSVKKSEPKKVKPRRPRRRVFWCEKMGEAAIRYRAGKIGAEILVILSC